MQAETSTINSSDSPESTQINKSESYKKSTSPSGAPLSQISLKLFPLTFKESFDHYWNKKDLLKVQHSLLSTLPFYPEPSETHSSEVINFKLKNSLVFPDINEFHIKPKDETKSNEKHLVIIHGYGAGLGFFIKNMEYLANEHPNWHIHAIDLPGYGCSSRVNFPYSIPFENYETVEKLFTIPLREWYTSNNLNEENSITVAHSMGGYLSLVMQINENLGTGFINKEEYKLLKSSLSSSFFDNNKEEKNNKLDKIFNKQLIELSNTDKNPKNFWNTLILVSPGGIYHHRSEEILQNTPTWFTKLWNQNISPFSLVRNSGPLGSLFVSGWTSRRFSINSLFDNKVFNLLHEYSYGIFNAKGSGEYMLNYLLAPGGTPRHPLVNRIDKIGKNAGKTIWLYGGHDWMDFTGGVLSNKILKNVGSPNCSVEIVPNAGHHIYLDAFNAFNKIISNQMSLFERKK